MLHDLLMAFPPALWNVRQWASPHFDPRISPRFFDPAFGPAAHNVVEISLAFDPSSSANLSWAIIARARDRRTLTVDDVLRAISTALFQRNMCAHLPAHHPSLARAEAARALRGPTGTPEVLYRERVRNVDLYGSYPGQGLYFRGLRPERQRDGELVYVVQLA